GSVLTVVSGTTASAMDAMDTTIPVTPKTNETRPSTCVRRRDATYPSLPWNRAGGRQLAPTRGAEILRPRAADGWAPGRNHTERLRAPGSVPSCPRRSRDPDPPGDGPGATSRSAG